MIVQVLKIGAQWLNCLVSGLSAGLEYREPERKPESTPPDNTKTLRSRSTKGMRRREKLNPTEFFGVECQSYTPPHKIDSQPQKGKTKKTKEEERGVDPGA